MYMGDDLKDCGRARRIQRVAQGGPDYSEAGTEPAHGNCALTSTESRIVLLILKSRANIRRLFSSVRVGKRTV